MAESWWKKCMDIKMHIRVAKCKKIRRGFGFILFLTKKIDSQVKLRSLSFFQCERFRRELCFILLVGDVFTKFPGGFKLI
jgi:hypothetical protein